LCKNTANCVVIICIITYSELDSRCMFYTVFFPRPTTWRHCLTSGICATPPQQPGKENQHRPSCCSSAEVLSLRRTPIVILMIHITACARLKTLAHTIDNAEYFARNKLALMNTIHYAMIQRGTSECSLSARHNTGYPSESRGGKRRIRCNDVVQMWALHFLSKETCV